MLSSEKADIFVASGTDICDAGGMKPTVTIPPRALLWVLVTGLVFWGLLGWLLWRLL
jgi:hypothetical protein